jgi:hypothetical protein
LRCIKALWGGREELRERVRDSVCLFVVMWFHSAHYDPLAEPSLSVGIE